MSYKSILVHVDNSEQCRVRIELALSLASRFEAHLCALAFVRPFQLPASVHTHFGPDLEARQMAIAKEEAEQALAGFRKLAARAGMESAEVRSVPGDPATAFGMHARYHDLAIIGQYEPSGGPGQVADGPVFQEMVVLGIGRPVLVVPYAGTFPRLGQRVVVAWDASREAARAVVDAMPFLRNAREVTVLLVNPEKNGRHGAEPGADIALMLARHGVKVNVVSDHAKDIDIGTFMLSRLVDLDADLLVMGAYGHSRLRELVIGGVTRTMFESMTVPVLMSH